MISSRSDAIEKILNTLPEAASARDRERSRRVIRFLRENRIRGIADYASSLLLVQQPDGGRLRAAFQISPNFDKLPVLHRTGSSSPYMLPDYLDLEGGFVTDRDLQNQGNRFVTREAAAQECIRLFIRLLELLGNLRSAENSPAPIFPSTSTCVPEEPWWNEAIELMSNLRAGCHTSTDQLFERIADQLGFAEARLPLSVKGFLRQQLQSRPGSGGEAKAETPEPTLISNLLTCLDRALSESTSPRHLSIFHFSSWRNLVFQSAATLSMNGRHVAFYRHNNEPKVMVSWNEPIHDCSYDCLVLWREGFNVSKYLKRAQREEPAILKTLGEDLAVARLRFFRKDPFIRLQVEKQPVGRKEGRHRLRDMVEFAVSGKLVLNAGKIVPPEEIVDEFLDLRHVFNLPNLNSAKDRNLMRGQKEHSARTPRHLFGQLQTDELPLLEYALLSDRSLRHLACTSTIAVPLSELGAPRIWIDACLLHHGYRSCQRLSEVREEGDFAWDEGAHPRLNIRLKLNTYPCTIVGIGNPQLAGKPPGKDDLCDTLFLLAWGHDFHRGQHTIWDCAEVLQAAGARFALVLDEGRNVFQCHLSDAKSATEFQQAEKNCESLDDWLPVPLSFRDDNGIKILRSRRIRASLAFWQQERLESVATATASERAGTLEKSRESRTDD